MRVVVTRPQPQAETTADRLRDLGHDPLVLPLTEIVALPQASVDAGGLDLVAVTSANALRHAKPEFLQPLAHLPLLAVGDRTADAARRLGFSDVTSAEGDVTALMELALARTELRASIVYLCGKLRRPDFEVGMARADRRVIPLETYDTRALTPGPDGIAMIGAADAILLYSQAAADALATLGPELPQTTLICMSARVAEAAQGFGRHIVIAEHPTEGSMLAALNRL